MQLPSFSIRIRASRPELLLLLVVGSVALARPAGAISALPPIPRAGIVISNLLDATFTTHLLPDPHQEFNQAGQKIWVFDNFQLKSAEYEVSVSAIADPDPSISYSLGVVDYGNPTAFGFLLLTPIVPTGSPNQVDSHVVGTLIDAEGDGVSLTALTPGALQKSVLGAPTTSMGVDLGTSVAFPESAPNATYGYGPYFVGPIGGPGPGPWTTLQAEVWFALSGGGDSVDLIGSAQVVPGANHQVPEAGTLAVGLALVAGIGAGRLRRRLQPSARA